MKLEIGSGTRPTPGYEHADINPDLPHLEYVCPMDAIPVEDNTFEEVRTVHVIEHVPVATAKKALREWLRILQPGGMAHIDTPNIRRNANLYLNGGWDGDFSGLTPEEKDVCSLNGVPNKTLWLNFKAFSSDKPFDSHFWNADPELLTALCLEAGFSRAEVAQENPSLIVHAYK